MAEEQDDPTALAIAEARGEIAVALEPLVRLSKGGDRTLATSDLTALIGAINGTVHALLNHIHGVEQPTLVEEPAAPSAATPGPGSVYDRARQEEHPATQSTLEPAPEREELF